MKTLLLSLVAALAITHTAQAQSDMDTHFFGMSSVINGNGGTLRLVEVDPFAGPATCQELQDQTGHCAAVVGSSSSCPFQAPVFYATLISSKKCCYDPYNLNCQFKQPAEASTEVRGETAELKDIFGSEQRNSYYFGYVNSTNRSPAAGRTHAPKATLDACVGQDNVEAYSGGPACRQACSGSQNAHCYDWGYNGSSYVQGAICQDRCDCTFGDASCEGL